jgi:tetratricopeptide (TPR) repeat protein
MIEDPTQGPEPHLARLAQDFMVAMELQQKGKLEECRLLLEGILQVEPRLPEPRLELARIWLESERLDDAEAQVREALRLLEGGGQWIETVEENVLMGMAWSILGEVLQRQATTDEVVFGPAERFRELVAASRAAYARAAELDPTDTASSLNAQEMEEPEEEEYDA